MFVLQPRANQKKKVETYGQEYVPPFGGHRREGGDEERKKKGGKGRFSIYDYWFLSRLQKCIQYNSTLLYFFIVEREVSRTKRLTVHHVGGGKKKYRIEPDIEVLKKFMKWEFK